MMTSIHELLKKEAEAVLNIPVSDAYEKAVALIVEQVHNKRGKLVTTGMGKSRTDSYEYCYHILFDRHSGSISASQRKHNTETWAYCRRMICCC